MTHETKFTFSHQQDTGPEAHSKAADQSHHTLANTVKCTPLGTTLLFTTWRVSKGPHLETGRHGDKYILYGGKICFNVHIPNVIPITLVTQNIPLPRMTCNHVGSKAVIRLYNGEQNCPRARIQAAFPRAEKTHHREQAVARDTIRKQESSVTKLWSEVQTTTLTHYLITKWCVHLSPLYIPVSIFLPLTATSYQVQHLMYWGCTSKTYL